MIDLHFDFGSYWVRTCKHHFFCFFGVGGGAGVEREAGLGRERTNTGVNMALASTSKHAGYS